MPQYSTAIPYILVSISLSMLLIFVGLQYIAMNNTAFLALTFSSYFILALSAIFLFVAFAKSSSSLHRAFVNVAVLLFVVLTLNSAYSLVMVPRGGIRTTREVAPEGFSFPIESQLDSYSGGKYSYSGGNYPGITLYAADYPVGYVSASSDWDFAFYLGVNRTVNLSGTLLASISFISDAGRFRETISYPAEFNGTTSMSLEPMYIRFLGWGSEAPSNRIRAEWYALELEVWVWLEGNNYGSALNFMISPRGVVYITDYQVDSRIQNSIAILLSGASAGIVCSIPIDLVRKRLSRKSQRDQAL